jgi:hypothetical protein
VTASSRRPVNLPLLSASISGGLLIAALLVALNPVPAAPPSPAPVLLPTPSPDPPASAMPNVTIVPAGTDYQVPAWAFVDVLFHLPMPGVLYGSYYADGNVTATILTPGEFEEFELGGNSSTCAWTAGTTTGAEVGAALPAGTYYLVFAAIHSPTPRLVDTATGIAAGFPLPG